MKENRMVSPFHERPLKVGDWVWVKTGSFFVHNPVTGPARVAAIDGDKILCEYPEQHPELHSGGINRPERCWVVATWDVTPLPMDFCIFRNAGATYCLRGDKRKVAGKAQFSAAENQDYDPLIGAVIAMARAYGKDPTAVALKVLKVFSAIPQPPVRTVAAAGLEQRVNDLAEQVDFLNDWCTSLTDRCDELAAKVEPKKKIRQLVIRDMSGEFYGVVGTPTKFKDSKGNDLYVGDRVVIRGKNGKGIPSESLMVETKEDGAFPMGLLGAAQAMPEGGRLDSYWLVDRVDGEVSAGDMVYTNRGVSRFDIKEEDA